MKLQEIREKLEDLGQMRIGETVEDYSQRVWDSKPRITYKKLPASPQKAVRQRFTPDILLDFLRTCYAPLEAERVIKEMVKKGAITIEKKDESHYLSFETVTANIPADAMENILIRTRNTATYIVEMEARIIRIIIATDTNHRHLAKPCFHHCTPNQSRVIGCTTLAQLRDTNRRFV